MSTTADPNSSRGRQTPEGLIQLLAAVAAGNRGAFAALYQDTSRKLYGVILRLLGDRNQAEDVLQEAYLRIWQRANSYNPERASAIAWMTAIARHGALDHLRRRSTSAQGVSEPLSQLEDPGAGPGNQAQAFETWQRLQQCLGGVGDPHAAMIRAAYLDGSSRQALAIEYEQPVSTIKTWLRRGLMQLKECLGET